MAKKYFILSSILMMFSTSLFARDYIVADVVTMNEQHLRDAQEAMIVFENINKEMLRLSKMPKQTPVQRLEAEIAQLEEKRKMINAKIKEKKELLANKKRAVLDKTLGNLNEEQI
ncbi:MULTISPECIES: hypothetical protein [Cysteiniphilum]|uniref:Uncharacterized protein n=1 Tax=Cysteiniphilum litorale TaxID=2056700 RepID=A0A8J3E7D8_9GAMM|nr:MULTISPECIES: hypothetical protein [Cysteiniphilum]GGF91220.1 hypothetical protein GCM10010995_05650 [Cysteiniphilum litorale]